MSAGQTTRTITEIKAANKAIGHHWFDADTMRFFGSRVGRRTWPRPGGGEYFISSEQREWDTPRCYSIREALPDGRIETVGEFMGYETRSQAIAAITQLVRS